MSRKLIKPRENTDVMIDVANVMFKVAEKNNVCLNVFSVDQDVNKYIDECMETLHQELTGKEFNKLVNSTGEILLNHELSINQYINDRTYNLLTSTPLYVLEIVHLNHELPGEYENNPLLQQIRLKESCMTLDNISSKLMDELRELTAFENTIIYCEIGELDDDRGANAVMLLPCASDEQAASVLDRYHQMGEYCDNTSVAIRPLAADDVEDYFVGNLAEILDIIEQATEQNRQRIVEEYIVE